jgi:FkbM family methyltransferase
MKQKLIYKILDLLSIVTGKSFFYITKNKNNSQGKTAVEDENGVWHVGNVFDKDDITYGIAQNGLVEIFETHLVHTILTFLNTKSNLVFYDIGANIGYYGLIAGTLHKATVHSFEPTPEYAKNILSAAKLNHISDRLTVHNYALSNNEGSATFTQTGSGSSLEADFNLGTNLPTTTVLTKILDTEVVNQNIPLPNFIKIDVEGHEWAVFEGATKTINKSKPIVFLEMCTTLSEIGRDYINPYYTKTLDFFNDQGYSIFLCHNNGTLEKWNKIKTINRAGMFLCLNTTNHDELLQLLTNKYPIKD